MSEPIERLREAIRTLQDVINAGWYEGQRIDRRLASIMSSIVDQLEVLAKQVVSWEDRQNEGESRPETCSTLQVVGESTKLSPFRGTPPRGKGRPRKG